MGKALPILATSFNTPVLRGQQHVTAMHPTDASSSPFQRLVRDVAIPSLLAGFLGGHIAGADVKWCFP